MAKLSIQVFRAVLVAAALCGSAESALAACSGTSPTRTAASAGRTDVNDCVTAAASGDTILVPAGTASWTSAIALPNNKDLTIFGNGGGAAMTCTGTPGTSGYVCTATNGTTLTCNTGCFSINLAASVRISGFTMTGGSGERLNCNVGAQNVNKHFRVDHNRLVSTGGWAPIRWFGDNNAVHPQGIWDHNRIENVALHTNGTDWFWDDSSGSVQHQLWAQDPGFGSPNSAVYYEANYVASSSTNFNDGNYGCRFVSRFNTIADAGTWTFEIHGMQGENRGCQRTEIYNNHVGGSGGFSEMRGGSGLFFGNTTSSNLSLNLTIDRSEYDESAGNFGTVRECGSGGADGNSSSGVDQHTSGQNGWRCRDQVGVFMDASLWTANPPNAGFGPWNQITRPVYIFLNSGVNGGVNSQGDIENKIVVNREFYCDSGLSGCNSGVRSGTKGAIPATCTTGMAYWATDEGTWNSATAGADGRLYRCSSTNTWTLYYTPANYPHPWTVGTEPEAPAAPTNLRILSTAALQWVLPLVGLCLMGRGWRRRSRA
jgi:hypothetical protein